MSHSAAIYHVRVRESRVKDGYVPLGDIDGQGSMLAQVLRNYFTEIDIRDDTRSYSLRYQGPMGGLSGTEAGAFFEVGAWGVASWVHFDAGLERRRASNAEYLKSGVLADLPPTSDCGTLAVHVAHQRGIKGLLYEALRQRFRDDFKKRVLEVTPVVPRNALDAAMEEGKIDQVRLVVVQKPADRFEDSQKWIRKEDLGRIELVLHPKRARRFTADLLRGFREEPSTIGELVRFEGMTFDQAKVRYEAAPGHFRTLNIERPEAGHAMTVELSDDYGLKLDADGEPTDESLAGALRQVLQETVSGEA